jgi:hypothetical protein
MRKKRGGVVSVFGRLVVLSFVGAGGGADANVGSVGGVWGGGVMCDVRTEGGGRNSEGQKQDARGPWSRVVRVGELLAQGKGKINKTKPNPPKKGKRREKNRTRPPEDVDGRGGMKGS